LIRYISTYGLIACAFLLSSLAIAQDQTIGSRGHCVIPEVEYWSLPESESGVVPINVEFFFLDLVEISDKLGRFSPSFVISFIWKDPRLQAASASSSAGACSSHLSEIWHPHFIFVNAAESADDREPMVEIYPDGRVVYSKRVTRQFTLDFDLRKFPFDQQVLTIEIASLLYGPNDVDFIATESGTDMHENSALQGWQLGEISSLPVEPIVTLNSAHATFAYAMTVQRQSDFYFWRLFFPLLLITLMSWSVFWLEPSQLGAQIAVATSAIFTLMAFLVSLGDVLPSVSYLSVADKIVVAATILVFLAFGESIVTGTLVQQNRAALARSIDQVGRWIYLALVVIVMMTTYYFYS
jgi:hypothetical protein